MSAEDTSLFTTTDGSDYNIITMQIKREKEKKHISINITDKY